MVSNILYPPIIASFSKMFWSESEFLIFLILGTLNKDKSEFLIYKMYKVELKKEIMISI